MIEEILEQNIVSKFQNALTSLFSSGVSIDGFWIASSTGSVKGVENVSSPAFLSVVAKPRAFESFSTPKADFAFSLALAVREELDPDRSIFIRLASQISGILQSWQSSIADVKRDFAAAGFSPAGFRLDGGDAFHDENRHALVFSQSFTVRGIITNQERNSNQ